MISNTYANLYYWSWLVGAHESYNGIDPRNPDNNNEYDFIFGSFGVPPLPISLTYATAHCLGHHSWCRHGPARPTSPRPCKSVISRRCVQ
eukprot:SAG11_NODE_3103_length_2688_cov_4.246813_2_plen_90_part_00